MGPEGSVAAFAEARLSPVRRRGNRAWILKPLRAKVGHGKVSGWQFQGRDSVYGYR